MRGSKVAMLYETGEHERTAQDARRAILGLARLFPGSVVERFTAGQAGPFLACLELAPDTDRLDPGNRTVSDQGGGILTDLISVTPYVARLRLFLTTITTI